VAIRWQHNPRARKPGRGFTLLEVLIAMAVLAFALTIITAGSSSSALYSKRIYRSTVAALLLRGTMLDVEEKYRKDGFPTNDVSGKDCDLPKAYAKQFKCKYDLVGLNLDDGAISGMTQEAQTVLAKAQETMAASGAMDKLMAGGDGSADPNKKVQDLAGAAKGAAEAGLDLNGLAKGGGDMMSLLGVILMSGDQGMNLLNLCDINISVLQMSMGIMVGELLPRILKRASDRTRKVVLHLTWKDEEGEKRALDIETFTTAVSQEEAQAIQQMKQMEKVEGAIQNQLPPGAPGGLPGIPGMPAMPGVQR
jgi:prepilin-type N-terminal cleavage/methylation domain-containing protein